MAETSVRRAQPSVLHGKNVEELILHVNFLTSFCFLTCTIDFCYFITLSVTLIFAGGHKICVNVSIDQEEMR